MLRLPDYQNALRCVVCGGGPASVVTEVYDGMPKGLVACADCLQAMKDRAVGVCWLGTTLMVVDGRRQVDE